MAELFLGGGVDPATHERTGDETRLDADDLTTHGVIVGMTGSGKTGMGIVLVEEVLRAGLPALLIDPKADLTNLCLTFPQLRPDDFRPWVDPGQADAAGVSLDDYATQQAELWTKGLLGWGLTSQHIADLRASTDLTVYTPGSNAGVPINLVGSLQAPADGTEAETVADEVEGYVTGLLGLIGVAADPLSSREHILLSNLVTHAWQQGRSLDLPTLVGMVGDPPIRKLGVFDIDQFFPPTDRMALAMRLNGLLASPSFSAWNAGSPLDIGALLYQPDGTPRCAIVTTAHLSDQERQFVTSLVLAKVVTWMRRQSGTGNLRALVYMDEVAGYLPPTAMPPTKKPIMTLMKTARAFGVGMVLATQNPVDVDYKALSNAGTWMIGRLQTERDKQRLLEGLTSASGAIDVPAVSDTISGLGKRQFVLRRAGADATEVITSRWAMSYLRGPMTRDQIAELMADRRAEATAAPTGSAPSDGAAAAPTDALGDDESPVMPVVADGVAVRWIDPAAPWLAEAGGDEAGTRYAAGIVARVHLRYDEAKADLVHDQEFECVLHPLTDPVDVGAAILVDYDDRDLRTTAPDGAIYRIPAVDLGKKTLVDAAGRALRDDLTRRLTIEIPVNAELKLYGRPGEPDAEFAARCAAAADTAADAETAKLRDKYEAKATRLRDQIEAASDRIDVLDEQAKGQRNAEVLSTAGSILGGLLGGRSKTSILGKLGTAAGRRGRSSASSRRVDAAENKVARLEAELAELELAAVEEVSEIDARWRAAAGESTTLEIGLERSDVEVIALSLAWMPVRAG